MRSVFLVLPLALLAACGDRSAVAWPTAKAPLPPAVQLSRAQVEPAAAPEPGGPDTRVLGAGPAGASCGIPALPAELLERVNAARAAGRRCGARAMGPAAPLKWDASLYSAASSHSSDMARRGYFAHRSPDGRDVSQRASASGYGWRSVGENIAGGDATVAAVMQGWLASPDHCANIMEPRFADIAVACVQQRGTQWGTYWTMVLGRKS